MTPLMLAAIPSWLVMLMVMVFLFVSFLMIVIVLMQRAQGGGLSGAFGSAAGSGQTAFGAKTGDVLTLVTIGFFVAFIVLASLLNFWLRPGATVPAAQPTAGAPADDPTTPEQGPIEIEGEPVDVGELEGNVFLPEGEQGEAGDGEGQEDGQEEPDRTAPGGTMPDLDEVAPPTTPDDAAPENTDPANAEPAETPAGSTG